MPCFGLSAAVAGCAETVPAETPGVTGMGCILAVLPVLISEGFSTLSQDITPNDKMSIPIKL
jgi:hypothetical protein